MLQTVAQAPYTSAHPMPSPATNVVSLHVNHGMSPTTPQDLPHQQENHTNGPQNTCNKDGSTTSPKKQLLLQLPKGAADASLPSSEQIFVQ